MSRTGVEDDKELQAYLNELSLNGTGPNGGIGRVNTKIQRVSVYG